MGVPRIPCGCRDALRAACISTKGDLHGSMWGGQRKKREENEIEIEEEKEKREGKRKGKEKKTVTARRSLRSNDFHTRVAALQ